MNNNGIKEVHISDIKSGDVIFHNGFARTVNKEFISNDPFMGKAIFGCNYNSGRIKVKKIENYGLFKRNK